MSSHVWRRRSITLLTLVIGGFAAIGACSKEEPAKPQTQPATEAEPAKPETQAVTEAEPAKPEPQPATEAEPAKPETKPVTEAEPAAETQPATETRPAVETQPAAETQPAEPKTVPMSFKKAPMDQIAKFLTEQMGKPVIPDEDVEKIKITIINPKPLPVSDAMYVLTTALHEHGVAIEERTQTVHLVPIDQVIRRQVKQVPADVDVTTETPTNRIVRKIFVVKHYDPTKLTDVLKPLMPSYGHITADPTTKKLIVVATVERLTTMAQIIAELDQPDVSGGELRVFDLEHTDVYEIIPTLEKLIAGFLGVEVKAVASSGGSGGEKNPGPQPRPPQPPGGKSEGKKPVSAGSIAIKAEKTPVLLIPEPRRSQIVVAAPTNVLAQVEVWLQTLDQPRPPSTKWEIVEVEFCDASELADQLTDMLSKIPDEALRSALRIFPFATSRRLVIAGSEQNRDMVKKWLDEIDIPDTGQRIQKTFMLKYADAQTVAENIEELFGGDSGGGYYERYLQMRYGGGTSERSKVTVTANVRRNSITVVASPEKMKQIEEQIDEWDKPLEGDEAAPLIITLKYADPETTKELLENLFVKKEQARRPWYYDWDEETPSPVGRLFGQFSFEAYPETGKLIVVSKNEENYEVIKELIAQIDSPQEAGLPRTIQLKFADAETVAEQLNALLNAPGTRTSILRRGRLKGGFEQFSDDRSPYSQARQAQTPAPQQRDPDQSQSVMNFWWQQPPSRDITARQPSNLVGKLRIVPNIERNMLLVAVPDEYADALEELIQELDRPGNQVLIKAMVAELTLDDSMSLGFRFSTDPSLFTSGDPLITENALRGLFEYQFEDTHANTHTFTFNADVNNLISLLGKMTDIKIKSEPKILTADNVEGEFFDGQDIPFISDVQLSSEGTRNDSFDYFPVGITLRVKPHITEEKTINLTVQLRVSSVVPGRTLFNGAIVDRRETTTQITLEHGKTFLISGILREVEREIIRKVPGLGDIPLLGELFKHRETAKVNTELLVFLTPYVIGPKGVDDLPRDAIETEPRERMEHYWPDPGISEGREPSPESAEQVTAALPQSVGEGG